MTYEERCFIAENKVERLTTDIALLKADLIQAQRACWFALQAFEKNWAIDWGEVEAEANKYTPKEGDGA